MRPIPRAIARVIPRIFPKKDPAPAPHDVAHDVPHDDPQLVYGPHSSPGAPVPVTVTSFTRWMFASTTPATVIDEEDVREAVL